MLDATRRLEFKCLPILGTVFVASCFLLPIPASTTTLPPTLELQRLHDVLNSPSAPTTVPNKPAPLIKVEEPTTPTLSKEAANTTFKLNSVRIEGVTTYEPKYFLPLFSNLTGQTISVKELYELIGTITKTYRNDGYVLARAVLPPQDITQGHVRIQLIEGELDQIEVRGDTKGSKLIRAYAEKLKGEPLNTKKLERYLLLMNDLPGISAKSTLKPASKSGASDLVIDIAYTEYSGQYGVSNWGTRYTGPNQFEGEVVANNQYADEYGWHDQTRVRGVQTPNIPELTYLDILHTLPFLTEGTEIDLGFHHSRSHPSYDLNQLELHSKTGGFSLKVEHPHIRSRKENLSTFGMFDWRDTQTKTLGTELSHDHIRALRGGVNWNYADDYNGLNNVRFEVSQGLGVLGASQKGDPNLSRNRGVGDTFTKFHIEASRLQRLHKSWNFLFSTKAQFATKALLAGEEFGVGGEHYGRGFDPSEIAGDRGIASKAELQINFPVGWEYFTSWQLFGFYDFGAVWQKDLQPTEDNAADTLSSWGFGIRSQLGKNLSLDFTLAKPLTRGVASDGGEDQPNLYVRVKNTF